MGLRILYLLFFVPAIASASLTTKNCTPALKPDLNNDGIVNYKDVWMIGRSFHLSENDYRFFPQADANCDQHVNDADWSYVWEARGKSYAILPTVTSNLHIYGLPEKIYVGKQYDFRPSIHLYASNAPFTAEISQSVKPDKGLGLSTPLLNKTYLNKKTFSYSYKTEIDPVIFFKPEKAGEYDFTTRVKVPETGKIMQESTIINVLPAKSIIFLPTKNPPFDIRLNVLQKEFHDSVGSEQVNGGHLKVHLTVTVKRNNVREISKMTIVDEHLRQQHYIDGQSHRAYPVYDINKPVWVEVSQQFFAKKQCKFFHAVVETPYKIVTSKPVKFCATPLKRKPIPKSRKIKRSSKPVISSDLKKYLCYSNQHIAISVSKGISSDYIRDIVKESGGKVVLHQPQVIPESKIELYIVEPKNIGLKKALFELYNKLDTYDIIGSLSLTSIHHPIFDPCSGREISPKQ